MTQPNRTIKNLADSARQRGIEHLGELGFARLCLNFEKALPDESLNSVIALMVEFPEPITMQLGCIWLDGAGYGGQSVEWLGAMLAKVKRGKE